ncbi:hypothetical protein [Paenibacillus aestuarii]|uniref:Uncharacterized protein n=1 Tax=Paenibacillus aestuarii TaxID=516965 RepID=A0ABW0K287_9BACL|nr:hypothetical protein [Paenibacillus aestuarii]
MNMITNQNYIPPTRPWDSVPEGWCSTCQELTTNYNRYGECNACGTSLYESKEAAEADQEPLEVETYGYCKRPWRL